jgi:hypothetical protein
LHENLLHFVKNILNLDQVFRILIINDDLGLLRNVYHQTECKSQLVLFVLIEDLGQGLSSFFGFFEFLSLVHDFEFQLNASSERVQLFLIKNIDFKVFKPEHLSKNAREQKDFIVIVADL